MTPQIWSSPDLNPFGLSDRTDDRVYRRAGIGAQLAGWGKPGGGVYATIILKSLSAKILVGKFTADPAPGSAKIISSYLMIESNDLDLRTRQLTFDRFSCRFTAPDGRSASGPGRALRSASSS